MHLSGEQKTQKIDPRYSPTIIPQTDNEAIIPYGDSAVAPIREPERNLWEGGPSAAMLIIGVSLLIILSSR